MIHTDSLPHTNTPISPPYLPLHHLLPLRLFLYTERSLYITMLFLFFSTFFRSRLGTWMTFEKFFPYILYVMSCTYKFVTTFVFSSTSDFFVSHHFALSPTTKIWGAKTVFSNRPPKPPAQHITSNPIFTLVLSSLLGGDSSVPALSFFFFLGSLIIL